MAPAECTGPSRKERAQDDKGLVVIAVRPITSVTSQSLPGGIKAD